MTTKNIGIEDARKTLGDLVTAVQQGQDVVLTRNGKPAARIVSYQEEMFGIRELAIAVGMDRAPEKVALWAGCFSPRDEFLKTGRLPKPWQGQGMDAQFTREQLDQLAAEWSRDSQDAEGLDYLTYGKDPEFSRIAERYRP
jgi:prevent-host-death family protein